MSAFVVDREHIDIFVALGVRGPSGMPVEPGRWFGPRWAQHDPNDHPNPNWRSVHVVDAGSSDRASADELGEILVLECVRSVSHRYPDNDALPGPIEHYWADGYSYRYRQPAYMPTAVEGLKAIDCYEYQSCEHREWPLAEAFRYCQALRGCLIGQLSGYDAAPWAWTAELIAKGQANTLLGR